MVVGAQWGDEGKAKIVDWLASRADVVARYQGGANAGHTVRHGDTTYKFHLIPSGILYPHTTCVIGSGTVIDPERLLEEIAGLRAKGIEPAGRLKVSNRAHLTLPWHRDADAKSEQGAAKPIGTTKRGIGPTYADKIARLGVRTADLLEPDASLRQRLVGLAAHYNLAEAELDPMLAWCREQGQQLAPYLTDTVSLLHEARKAGKRILFEGAQGTGLDVDFGTYPYVTSSNATAGGACTGTGMGPGQVGRVIGVMKAYTTRVGEGPFPTELLDDTGKRLAEVGHEIGTTTGRARRCGWFDAAAARWAVMVNGLDGIALTKLDVLDAFDEINVAVAYRHRETGEQYTVPPAQLSVMEACEPVYETFTGWNTPTTACRQFSDLPEQAQHYLQAISRLLQVPIDVLSIGPGREETLVLQDPFGEALASGASTEGITPSLLAST